MLDHKRIAVVVPAYNEEALIGTTLAGMPPYVDDILVVDDASTDRTVDIVQRAADARIVLLRQHTNQGVGAAIACGFGHAAAARADITVVMAADAQMHPDDLPSLLRPLLEDRADYAKGNRLAWPNARRHMPWQRWLGNHVLAALTRWATGLPVRDSQCGYTAMNRRAQHALPWEQLWSGYGYPNDLLSWLAVHGLRVIETPVRPVYATEQSGLRLYHALFVIPYIIVRARLRRLTRPHAFPNVYAPSMRLNRSNPHEDRLADDQLSAL